MADKETKAAVSNNDGENDAEEELVVGGDKPPTLSPSEVRDAAELIERESLFEYENHSTIFPRNLINILF